MKKNDLNSLSSYSVRFIVSRKTKTRNFSYPHMALTQNSLWSYLSSQWQSSGHWLSSLTQFNFSLMWYTGKTRRTSCKHIPIFWRIHFWWFRYFKGRNPKLRHSLLLGSQYLGTYLPRVSTQKLIKLWSKQTRLYLRKTTELGTTVHVVLI